MADITGMEEEKVRLVSLEEIVRTLLIHLVNYFVCNQTVKNGKKVIVTSDVPETALNEVLNTRNKKELTELSNLTNLRSVINFIFTDTSPLTLKSKIYIANWDLTALVCLLEHISLFPTSKEKFRKQNISCVGIPHTKCCDTCQHVNKVCKTCKTSHETCFRNSTPCCKTCQMCLYCSNRTSSPTCDNTKLRVSIDTIRNMRNFIHHSSPSVFDDLRNGNFSSDVFPSVNNFRKLYDFCSSDVLVVLEYLYKNNAINKFRYNRIGDDVTNNIPSLSKDKLYEQYRICVDAALINTKLLEDIETKNNQTTWKPDAEGENSEDGDEMYIKWQHGNSFFYAITMDEKIEEVTDEELEMWCNQADLWKKNENFPITVYFCDKATRVAEVDMSGLNLKEEKFRVTVFISNKDDHRQRYLEIPVAESEARHVCKYYPGRRVGSSVTVYTHYEDDKDTQAMFTGCTRKRQEKSNKENIVNFGCDKVREITSDFDWAMLCLKNGFFSCGKKDKEEVEDNIIYLDDWNDMVMENWERCYSLESQVIHGHKNNNTFSLISGLKEENNGIFIFSGYNLIEHASFMKETVDCDTLCGSYETFLVFIPNKQIVVLIVEIESKVNETALFQLHHVITNTLQREVELFLNIHSKHFIKGELSIIPWLVVRNMRLESYPFFPCCEECKENIFFEEHLSDSSEFVKRFELRSKRVKKSTINKECREEYKKFLAHIVGFMSTAYVNLPNPRDDVSDCVNKIFLTKAQYDVLSWKKSSHAFITGGYGSGKSIIMQLKFVDMMKTLNRRHKIYFISYSKKSLLIHNMKKVAECIQERINDGPEMIIENYVELSKRFKLESAGLLDFLEKIAEENNGSQIISHLIMDEYNPAQITREKAARINVLLQQGGMVNSIVWIAPISMSKQRYKTTSSGENSLVDGYKLKETGMKLLQLGRVFRFTDEVYNLMTTAIDVIKKHRSQFVYNEEAEEKKREKEIGFDDDDDSDNNDSGNGGDDDGNDGGDNGGGDDEVDDGNDDSGDSSGDVKDDDGGNEEVAEKDASDKQTERKRKREQIQKVEKKIEEGEEKENQKKKKTSKQSKEEENEKIKEVENNNEDEGKEKKREFDELDHTFKVYPNIEVSENSVSIQTAFDFWESLPCDYNVSGEMPLLISLAKEKSEMVEYDKTEIIFQLYLALINFVEIQETSSVAFICTSVHEAAISEEALKLAQKRNSCEYIVYLPTLRPKEHDYSNIHFGEDQIILTDMDGVTGLEFEKVVIAVTGSEHFLSHTIVRNLSRSQNKLYFFEFPEESLSLHYPITKEIITAWRDEELVRECVIKMESKCRCKRNDRTMEVEFCREEKSGDASTYYACPRLFKKIKKQTTIVNEQITEMESNVIDWYCMDKRFLSAYFHSNEEELSTEGTSNAITGVTKRARFPEDYYTDEMHRMKWQVPKYFTDLRTVGTGAYSAVCAAKDSRCNHDVAINKVCRPFQSLLHAKRTYLELSILKHMEHESVISLMDVFTPQETLHEFEDVYLVTQLWTCNLNEILKVQELTDEHVQFLIYQLLRGLKYIHSAGVIHRDLKPSRISVNENCEAVIHDAGLARASDDSMTGYVSTRWYRSPEMLLNIAEIGISSAADIWSVGCIMAELLTGKALFTGQDHIDQITKIFTFLGSPPEEYINKYTSGNARDYLKKMPNFTRNNFQTLIPHATQEACDILDKMLFLDPCERWSATQCLQHPYLENYHDPDDEPTAPLFEPKIYGSDVCIEDIKKLMFEEIKSYVWTPPPEDEDEDENEEGTGEDTVIT